MKLYKSNYLIYTLMFIGLCIIVFWGCEPSWERKIDRDALYLAIDSTNKTHEEKQEYERLKRAFLEHWLDSNNCYMDKNHKTAQKPGKYLNGLLNVYVDNIFHTPKNDTVIVIVSFYTAWLDSNGILTGRDIQTQAMIAVIDSIGKWHFNCEHGGYWFSYQSKDTTDYTNEKLKSEAKDYRRLLVGYGILDKNKKIDRNFFYKYYSEDLKINKSYGR